MKEIDKISIDIHDKMMSVNLLAKTLTGTILSPADYQIIIVNQKVLMFSKLDIFQTDSDEQHNNMFSLVTYKYLEKNTWPYVMLFR